MDLVTSGAVSSHIQQWKSVKIGLDWNYASWYFNLLDLTSEFSSLSIINNTLMLLITLFVAVVNVAPSTNLSNSIEWLNKKNKNNKISKTLVFYCQNQSLL